MKDPTKLFSDRADNYTKYRPTYPRAVIEALTTDCRLTPASIVADIGSGTGILTRLFLQNGNRVFGVEPNPEMREAGERALEGFPSFTSIAATAESTTLPDHAVDFVTAGQAFHWFDRERTLHEFARILRTDGWLVLIWNDGKTHSTPFLEAYESLSRSHAIRDERLERRPISEEVMSSFFRPGEYGRRTFGHERMQSFEEWKGALLSTSYAPLEGHPGHAPMIDALRAIFDAHQVDGLVPARWDTNVYYGRLA